MKATEEPSGGNSAAVRGQLKCSSAESESAWSENFVR